MKLETLLPVSDGHARVQTLFTGISRGTERLVSQGAVPESEWPVMRAPYQDGDFPFPVKYGYSAAGRVVEGPEKMLGQSVFCLYPHQEQFVVPLDALIQIPAAVPLRRATLAANMETALNAVWDAAALPGAKVAVVGAGIVGLLTARLVARLPAASVTVIDINRDRLAVAEDFGCTFALPGDQPTDCDVVFHTSASAAGLQTAIACAGLEGTVVEMSWYGTKPVTVDLGGRVHSKRLRIVASQVGRVAPAMRPRWTHRRRLKAALELLADPVLDHLVRDEIAFDEAPESLPIVLNQDYQAVPPVIAYSATTD
ncbi:MAG: zinc-dependent alcohol dehydrogenase [Hyphomicrobiaceae bacterium]